MVRKLKDCEVFNMKNYKMYEFYDGQVKAIEETINRLESQNNCDTELLHNQKQELEEIRDSYL